MGLTPRSPKLPRLLIFILFENFPLDPTSCRSRCLSIANLPLVLEPCILLAWPPRHCHSNVGPLGQFHRLVERPLIFHIDCFGDVSVQSLNKQISDPCFIISWNFCPAQPQTSMRNHGEIHSCPGKCSSWLTVLDGLCRIAEPITGSNTQLLPQI